MCLHKCKFKICRKVPGKVVGECHNFCSHDPTIYSKFSLGPLNQILDPLVGMEWTLGFAHIEDLIRILLSNCILYSLYHSYCMWILLPRQKRYLTKENKDQWGKWKTLFEFYYKRSGYTAFYYLNHVSCGRLRKPRNKICGLDPLMTLKYERPCLDKPVICQRTTERTDTHFVKKMMNCT